MKINKAGIDLIKRFEGCRLKSYPDPATKKEPYTIGYGHTGPNIIANQTITQEQADVFLVEDLAKFETGVSKLIKVPLTPNEFSALVSFSYNLGLHNLERSSLLVAINEGKKDEAADGFRKWDHANGKFMQGLLTRRLAERELFLSKAE